MLIITDPLLIWSVIKILSVNSKIKGSSPLLVWLLFGALGGMK